MKSTMVISMLHSASLILFSKTPPGASQRSLKKFTLPRRKASTSLRENYTQCDLSSEPSRFLANATSNACNPSECYTDCLCNHVAIDGFCEVKTLGGKKRQRCVCYDVVGHPRFQVISWEKCRPIREVFFGRSKFSLLQGCNQICRSDCVCNHGAQDGLCSTINGHAYCACIFDYGVLPSIYGK